MRKYLFLILVAVAFLAFAVQKIYVGVTNFHPTRMTCKQFLDTSPSAKWIELTDCEVDYPEAISLKSAILKMDKGTYVPVRAPGDTGSARILLKMNSDAVAAKLDAWFKTQLKEPSSEPSTTMPASEKTETVTGLISFGMDEDSKARRALESEVTAGKLDAGYIVIDDHAKPDPGDLVFGIAIVAAAVVLLVVFVRRRKTPTLPPPLPTALYHGDVQ